MSMRIGALVERVRGSLFFVPMLFVIVGSALGVLMVEVDAELEEGATRLPFVLTSTVDSAREVLGVVAAATITVAGIAFSVSLLVIQQASAQYSPRVVHSLFRDPFNRRVMGLAVGTFAYSLMVLRAVRGPLEDGGDPIVPNLSVAVALLLGVVSILAIVAFIDHNAHTMEVSQILDRVAHDTVTQMERFWPDGEPDGEAGDPAAAPPDGAGHTVLLGASGWVQQLDLDELAELVPKGGTVRTEIAPGRYAVVGTPLCTVWPPPDDHPGASRRAAASVQIGPVRTMQQDPTYGVRQLADVALVALSPGVNDPTTAQAAIFHLAEVVRCGLTHELPAEVEREGRRIMLSEHPSHDTLVELAFDEIRQAAAALPTVSVYLLEALHLVERSVRAAGFGDRLDTVRRQAELTLAGVQRADLLPADREVVEAAFARRFGADGPG